MVKVENLNFSYNTKEENLFDINLDIEIPPETTVLEAHRIAEELTLKIKENIENVYDVVIHIEPFGIKNDDDEGFGLCPQDVKDIDEN